MASTILGALLRRDGNRARRAGTGRQTTKRPFALHLPGAQPHHRGIKRDSKGLADVATFWGEEQQQHCTPAAPPRVEDDAENIAPVPMPQSASLIAPSTAERRSMGTSPIVIPLERQQHSMGTSPLAVDGATEAGPSSSSPHNSEGEPSDSSMLPEPEEEPYAGDDFNGPVDNESDNESDSAAPVDVPEPPEHAPEEELAALPAPKTAKAPKQGGRKRKTSLEKLGLNPGADRTAQLPDGGGRSRRQRFRPLEFWRNERVVYGRRDSAKFEAIIDVVVAEKEETPPHFRARNKRAALMLKDQAADPLANAQDAMVVFDEDAVAHDADGRRKKKKAKKGVAIA
jgi:hypothetical protein